MRPFTTFSDCAVLEGPTPNLGSPEVEAAQPNITPKEQTPTRLPTPLAAVPPNEPVSPDVGHEHPGWVEVHLSHPVAFVGHVPMSLGDLRWHHQSQSSSQRKAQCCWREEQWGSGLGDSSSASSQGSPVPACWTEEDPHQEDLLKTPPPGFQEIASFLTGDDYPRTTTCIPPESMPPDFVEGSAMTVMMFMGINHDERTDATYMSTVTTSVGVMNLGAPLKVATGQTVAIEDITDANMVDNHSN